MGSDSDSPHVLVAVDGHVATVTLNRPERRNPLSVAMLAELRAALTRCRDNETVRVVVLTGAGNAFCAGADLTTFQAELPQLGQALVDLFRLMEQLGKPIVGRVNGPALAGGFGLACACDLLVAADTASFGTPEINVGIWPLTILAVAARNLPRKVLLEMAMTGERWSAARLYELGLVNRVLPAAELDAATRELAGTLAGKSAAGMRLGRRAFYAQQDMDFAGALSFLRDQLLLAGQDEDAREGIQAFLRRRIPTTQPPSQGKLGS